MKINHSVNVSLVFKVMPSMIVSHFALLSAFISPDRAKRDF